MPARANIARTDNHATKLRAYAERHHDQRITTPEATP